MVTKLSSFPQFPIAGEVIETPTNCDDHGKYVVNMDIGWCMRRQNSYATKDGFKTVKTCMESVRCVNESCVFFNVENRPKSTEPLVKSQCEQGCRACKQKLVHISCLVRAIFTCYGVVCRLSFGDSQGEKEHSHGRNEAKHLSEHAREEFEYLVLSNSLATPKSLVVGLNKGTER